MPRIKIDVSDAWLNRLRQVLPAAIDALSGWEHQIQNASVEDGPDADDLLQQLHAQMVDLRRSIEAVRIIF